MLNRVLILSASAGAGHIRAAQAVEKALLERRAAAEVRHLDTLDYTNKLFRRLYSQPTWNGSIVPLDKPWPSPWSS